MIYCLGGERSSCGMLNFKFFVNHKNAPITSTTHQAQIAADSTYDGSVIAITKAHLINTGFCAKVANHKSYFNALYRGLLRFIQF
jgi:hypothetical protein